MVLRMNAVAGVVVVVEQLNKREKNEEEVLQQLL
jgi:hypothetical protein